MRTTSDTTARSGHTRVISAARVQGTSVTNPGQENLGTIRDVVLDKHDGTIRYAVLEFGRFLGTSTRLFALPWELLRYDDNADAYVINVDKKILKAAPGFDSSDWPDMDMAAFDRDLRRYYGLSATASRSDSALH